MEGTSRFCGAEEEVFKFLGVKITHALVVENHHSYGSTTKMVGMDWLCKEAFSP